MAFWCEEDVTRVHVIWNSIHAGDYISRQRMAVSCCLHSLLGEDHAGGGSIDFAPGRVLQANFCNILSKAVYSFILNDKNICALDNEHAWTSCLCEDVVDFLHSPQPYSAIFILHSPSCHLWFTNYTIYLI